MLDGGFPALLHHLSGGGGGGGPLEHSTLVINHDTDKYQAFLTASGRRELGEETEGGVRWRPRADLVLGTRRANSASSKKERGVEDRCDEGKGNDRGLAEELRVALTVARRLQHTRMSERIAALVAGLEAEEKGHDITSDQEKEK